MPTPAGTVIPITLDGEGIYTLTRDITGEPSDPITGDYITGWWSIEAPADGTIYADTFGSGFDTIMGVYESTVTTEIAHGDTFEGGEEAALEWEAVEGDLYYLYVISALDPDVPADVVLTVRQPVTPPDTEPDGPAVPDLPDLVAPDAAPLIYRVSETYGAPPLTDGILTGEWTPTIVVRVPVGTLRVIIEGIDVTDWRGARVEVQEYTRSEPFGSRTARLSVEQATPFDGPSAVTWLGYGNTVDIVLLRPDTSHTVLWSGEIMSVDVQSDDDSWEYAVECVGAAWRAGQQVHKPQPILAPTDIGTIIRRAFGSVVSRRLTVPALVTTGILTSQRGSSDQSILERVADLLSTATTNDGDDQWTVAEDTPRVLSLRLKDRTTVDWSLTTGQPGCRPSLGKDRAAAPNCIYGHGIATNGYAWSKRVYPLAKALTYVPYPGSLISTGDSGAGVETAQQRLVELGYRATVDGTFSSADANAVKVFQRDRGLTIDGIIGPQTWSALFPQYPINYLDGSFRLPLAFDTRIMPRRYYPDGSDAGANPGFVSGYPRIEVDISFGENVTKADGIRSANDMLARDREPGWLGSIDLGTDPQEGSIFDIREGHNLRLKRWETTTGPLLHIAEVTVFPQRLEATVQVDEKARDILMITQIKQRNLEAIVQPNRLPARKLRSSNLVSDAVIRFEGESPAGVIRKLALIGGLWVYVDIPVSEVGTVASLTLQTSPATKFVVAFFGDLAVTPSDLISHVGADPLAERGDGFGPFDWHAAQIASLGFIQAYGGPGQAAGYDRNSSNDGSGYETSPFSGGSTTVTGCLRNTASWSYRSTRPPFLRAFFFAPDDCTISGRLLPAPLDV
jgi:hypothetical protein